MCVIFGPLVLAAIIISVSIHLGFRRVSYEESQKGLTHIFASRVLPLMIVATLFITALYFFACPGVSITVVTP